MRAVLAVAFVTSALAAGGCDKTNGAYCDSMTACPLGQTCNATANECEGTPFDLAGIEASALVDMAKADLTPICASPCTGDTPICNAPNCVGCQTQSNPESACAALSSTTPHCLLGDDAGAIGGACAGCRTSAMDCTTDPTKAICDPTSHVCRGCIANTDCASLVCDLQFDATHGTCVAGSKVIYVDGNLTGPACPGDGSFAHPRCKLADGVMDAKNSAGAKTIIHVTNANYAENLTLDFTVTLIGDPGATIQGTGNNNAVTVTGTGVAVTLYGFKIVGSNGRSTVTCNDITHNETLTVLNCNIQNGGWGIDGQDCFSLTVDSSVIAKNALGGIQVGSGDAALTNNFIVQNGAAVGASSGGVKLILGTANSVKILNNTIADNLSGTGTNLGVDCTAVSGLTFKNDILFNNKNGAGVNESQCPSQLYVATDDHPTGIGPNNIDLSALGANAPKFVDNASLNYHLMSGSPCIGMGLTGVGVPTHDIDGQARPGSTSMTDIGADQYSP